MRRACLLLAGVILLSTATAAASSNYFTRLYTEDRTVDLYVDGWYRTQVIGGKPNLLLNYDVRLENDKYNETSVTGFVLYLANESGRVAETDLNTGTVDSGGGIYGWADLESRARPTSITEFGFVANHTALLASGGEVERRVAGPVDVQFSIPNQTISNLTTNASTAGRGEDIWVFADTAGVRAVTMNGDHFRVELGGAITTTITVPADSSTGPRQLNTTIVTDVNHTFYRTVNITVVNRPPNLTLQTRSSNPTGGNTSVTLSAMDDAGIAHRLVQFRGSNYTSRTDTVPVPLDGVPPGNYTVTGWVVDTDGALATASSQLQVTTGTGSSTTPSDPEQPRGDQSSKEDRETAENLTDYSEPDKVANDPIGFITQFIGFIAGAISFLNPF